MKKSICILFGLIFSYFVFAQENNRIMGAIFDKATGNILVAASVYYKNLPYGTITNDEGEYLIDKLTEGDSLVFSYIGYTTQKYGINQVPDKIYLEPSVTNLSEIVVAPGYAEKIAEQIRKKYNKIDESEKKNKSKLTTFFYRQITQNDDVYNEFVECFLTGNNTFRIDNLKLQEGRYAALKKDSVYPYFTFPNFFYISQITPFREKDAGKNTVNTFLQPNFKTIYYVTVEDMISDKNGDILVLNFTPREQKKNLVINTGKLYVRESDLSIIRFEGMTQAGVKFKINYKERPENYPIVESVSCFFADNVTFYKNKKVLKKLDAKTTSTLFVVDQTFDNSGKKLKMENDLHEVIDNKKYNPEFWRNNPIIKRTKIDEVVIKSLEGKNLLGNFEPENAQ